MTEALAAELGREYGAAGVTASPAAPAGFTALRFPLPDGDHLCLTLVGTSARVTLYNAATDTHLGRAQAHALPVETLRALLRAWHTPADRAQRYRQLLAVAEQSPVSPPDLFYRPHLRPGDDGCLRVAGHVEPYPGAWPGGPAYRAMIDGDLTALWPYLAP